MRKKITVIFLCAAFLFSAPTLDAGYGDQLKVQVREAEQDYSASSASAYFKLMGMIARKADDAKEHVLLGEILNKSLWGKMDAYIQEEVRVINDLFETQPLEASQRLKSLLIFQKHYEPSQDFLQTSEGKGFAGDFARQRQQALEQLNKNPSKETFISALSVYQKTGLFFIKNNQVENDLNQLLRRIGCAVGWRKEIDFKHEQEFKTEYERGTVIQEGKLILQTSADNYAEAEWKGSWIYRYKGRDGVGQGTSEAVLKFKRGGYETEIVIKDARLSSTGRFNFPTPLNAVKRLVEIHPPHLLPRAELFEERFNLTGCGEEKLSVKPATKRKTGRVLLG